MSPQEQQTLETLVRRYETELSMCIGSHLVLVLSLCWHSYHRVSSRLHIGALPSLLLMKLKQQVDPCDLA